MQTLITNWAPFGVVLLPDFGKARMQPVFVTDVAEALSYMTRQDDFVGKTIELVGPREYTYKGLVELFKDASMNQHHVLPLPKAVLK
jgi:uncharacterized protein YbjT (DUF2867 family)